MSNRASVFKMLQRSLLRYVFASGRNQVRSCCQSTTAHSLPIKVGARAPSFKCKAFKPPSEFTTVSLDDYHGKYLVLFFYPLDFTFVCPTEITAFSDRLEEFKQVGAEVLGGSCDSAYSHQAWAKIARKNGGILDLKYPLLADLDRTVASAYNVLNADGTFPIRGLFIVDKKGTLRHMSYNDSSVGRSVDEALRLVQAIKFVDEHGEVCPINWKPGSKAINVNASGDYFKDVS